MDAEVHEGHRHFRFLWTPDVLEDVQCKLLAQIIVVPVAPERKGDVEYTLVHQRLGVFHQVEHLLVPNLPEDAFHTGEVGAEQFAEAGEFDHLFIEDGVLNALAVEP